MADEDHDAEWSWASERHLRISFGPADCPRSQARVHQALAALKRARPAGVLEITPAYSTLLLELAPEHLDEGRVETAVRTALADAACLAAPAPSPIIEIPVCYDPSCAPDLDDVIRLHGIDLPTLIRLHTQPVYFVQFIGFAPGFGYLTGMPSSLATPRLSKPRVRVPAGSVGIAGWQTGVYPMTTPGGWRLVGRTPRTLFDASRERPSLLAAGDRVRFVSIGLTEYHEKMRGAFDHE